MQKSESISAGQNGASNEVEQQAIKQALSEAEASCKALQSERDTLSSQLERTQAELTAQLEDIKRHSEAASLDHEKARIELQQLQKERDSSRELHDRRLADGDAAERLRADLQKRMSDVAAENTALKQDLETANNGSAQAKMQARRLADELTNLRVQHDQAVARSETSLHELGANRVRCGELQGRLDTTVKDHIFLAEAHKASKEECRRLATENRASSAEIDAMQGKLQAMNSQLVELRNRLEMSQQNQESIFQEVQSQRESSRKLEDTLANKEKTHERTVSEMSDVIKEMKQAPERGKTPIPTAFCDRIGDCAFYSS